MVFSTKLKVRFSHVDAAGIVFYPRYYEMLNEVIERWLEEGLGTSFRELHLTQNLGMPARNIAVDFLKASELGEELSFELRVRKIGRASLALGIGCFCAGEQRLNADVVLVCVSLEPFAAVPLPEGLRSRMVAFGDAP